MNTAEQLNWQLVCNKSDLIANSGVCVLINGEQIALFYLPHEEPQIYAVGNWDPIGKANVISRGIVGDLGGKLLVASPLYKQHFELDTGLCLEDENARLPTYSVSLDGDQVSIAI